MADPHRTPRRGAPQGHEPRGREGRHPPAPRACHVASCRTCYPVRQYGPSFLSEPGPRRWAVFVEPARHAFGDDTVVSGPQVGPVPGRVLGLLAADDVDAWLGNL